MHQFKYANNYLIIFVIKWTYVNLICEFDIFLFSKFLAWKDGLISSWIILVEINKLRKHQLKWDHKK